MSDTSRRRGSVGNGTFPGRGFHDSYGFSPDEFYPGRDVRGSIGLSPGELSAGRELRGRTGLYKADLVGRIASVRVDSDWVTPLRISPQTCTGCFRSTFLFLLRIDGLDVVWWSADVQHDRLLVTLVSRFTPAIFISVWIVSGSRSSFGGACVITHWERLGQYLVPPGNFEWIVLILYYICSVVAGSFMASSRSSEMDQADPSYAPSGPSYAPSALLPVTFLGLALDLRSDRLCDLAPDIPDVMGLRALWPSAAIVKVMSVPDSLCIQVVTPDDHVNIGYHEVLLHDMEEEDLPFVATSELGYLRRAWPTTLFMFMSRYQHDLERMRKECKERFSCTQSGNCTHCGKYIQRDLGKHIALYHLELAQLWRCPVMWCTVWKGTAQDCIDHMRRGSRCSSDSEGGKSGPLFSTVDSY